MKKYWVDLKISLANNLEYRGQLFVWFLNEFVGLVSTIFIWTAIFRTNTSVGTYNFQSIISYFILIPLIGAFTGVFVSDYFPRKIKNGEISSDIVKPYSVTGLIFVDTVSVKITQFTIKVPIYLVAGYLLANYFRLELYFTHLLEAMFVCIFSFLLHFFIDLAISYSAFWFQEVWSLGLLISVIITVFGGLAFPLDLVPEGVRTLFSFLPFRFIFYFPIKIAQGQVPPEMILKEFFQMLVWIGVFFLLCRLLWKNGLKKYGAYGN